jgi:hypothetical protein
MQVVSYHQVTDESLLSPTKVDSAKLTRSRE